MMGSLEGNADNIRDIRQEAFHRRLWWSSIVLSFQFDHDCHLLTHLFTDRSFCLGERLGAAISRLFLESTIQVNGWVGGD